MTALEGEQQSRLV